MKKRFFVLFFAFLLLIPCLALAASAADPADPYAAAVSTDLQTVKYRGVTYVRFDARYTRWWDSGYEPSQAATCDAPDVASVELTFSRNNAIVTADIYYKDGSRLTAHYISPSYLAEHQALMDKEHAAVVDFGYPSNNTVSLIPGALISQPVSLRLSSNDYHIFEVSSPCTDGRFTIMKGLLVAHKEQFYYIDYEASGISFPNSYYTAQQLNGMVAYAITDPALLLELEAAYDRYNSLSFGAFTGSVMDGIGNVLLVLVFGAFPLVVLVVFLILALRAKTRAYKKIFTAIYITAAAELALFAILGVLFTVLK